MWNISIAHDLPGEDEGADWRVESTLSVFARDFREASRIAERVTLDLLNVRRVKIALDAPPPVKRG
jgi:hypothetical protein